MPNLPATWAYCVRLTRCQSQSLPGLLSWVQPRSWCIQSLDTKCSAECLEAVLKGLLVCTEGLNMVTLIKCSLPAMLLLTKFQSITRLELHHSEQEALDLTPLQPLC